MWFSEGLKAEELKAASSALALVLFVFSPLAGLKSPTWKSFENKEHHGLPAAKKFRRRLWDKNPYASTPQNSASNLLVQGYRRSWIFFCHLANHLDPEEGSGNNEKVIVLGLDGLICILRELNTSKGQ